MFGNRPLRVVSYNLFNRNRPPVDEERQAGQVEVIRGLDPDVLCVQEFFAEGDDLPASFAAFGDALGMAGQAARSHRTRLHVGVLAKPALGWLGWRAHDHHLWHNLLVATLDVGAARPVRVAAAHLNPFDPAYRLGEARQIAAVFADPARATVVAADWNTIGETDPEPDWSAVPPHEAVRHLRWDDDPPAAPLADRRPTGLLHRAGLVDAARQLGAA